MDIGSVPFDAKAIHERIKIMRRGCSDKQLFWRLMACFCARKLLDAVEDTDAAAFSSFVDEAFANLKMKATFRKYEELSLVLDRRSELGHAIATFADAKRKALCDALADAARDYFGQPSAAGRLRWVPPPGPVPRVIRAPRISIYSDAESKKALVFLCLRELHLG